MPLTYAILAAYRLNSATCVERLCAYHADPNSNGSKDLRRAIHVALEARAYYPLVRRATPLEEEAEGRYLETAKHLVRAPSGAGAIFDTFRWGLSKTTALAEALCQCNPTGLRAMLEEGVELYKALGTGQIAFHSAAVWTKYKEKSYTEEERQLRGLSVEAFIEKRKLGAKENLRTVKQHCDGPLWVKVNHHLEAILQGKGSKSVALIQKLLDSKSFRETAVLASVYKEGL